MPYQFDPPNRNKFGYKDTLPADHPEKIIKGYEFDDEFKKIEDYTTQLEQDIEQISIDAGGIEEAPFDQIAYARQQGDWTPVDVVLQSPDAGAYIRKDVTAPQQIVSTEFTFAFDGGVPLTMKNTGMYVNADYIRHNATEWEVNPSLNVVGNITAGGDLTVDGSAELNGNLSVDGTIDATGNISTEANLNVTGDITGSGNITLNGGNIIIDGGSIVDPDGNDAGSPWTQNEDGSIEYGGTVVYSDNRLLVPHILGVGDFDGYAPSGGTIVARGDGGSTKIACKNKQHDAEAGINLETGNTHKWRIANHGLTKKLIFTTGSTTPTDGSGQVTIDETGNAMFASEVRSNCDGGSVRINPRDQGATSPHIRFWGNQGGSWYNVGKSTPDGKFHINVGANFDSPSNSALTIDPTGNATFSSNVTAPDFVATSDERAKEQISPMPVGLIDDIKPVQWTWKDSGEKSAGVIAQQLQEIGLDDFVKEDANGMLGVNYNALISILIAEVISLKKDRQ